MKKLLKVLLVLMTVVSIAGCSSKTTTEKATKKTKTLSGNYQVEIKVKDYGTIYAEIDADTAPITVTNFVKLSKEKFYDDLTFHRIIDGFMIQGGDPTGTGAGGPGYQFGDEFIEEFTFNEPGKLAMANAGPGTNGSQFFITHVPTEWLNYKHTIFGEVVSDADQAVVNKVEQGDTIETIEITGDVDKFLEANKEMTEKMDEILAQTMPNLKK